MRKWVKESAYHWRCAPWTICLCFLDGCSMYVLSKDGETQATAYKDELADVMKIAREKESGIMVRRWADEIEAEL